MKLIVLAATLPDGSKQIVYEPEIIDGKCQYLSIFEYFCELEIARQAFPNIPDMILLKEIKEAWSGKKYNKNIGPESSIWKKTRDEQNG